MELIYGIVIGHFLMVMEPLMYDINNKHTQCTWDYMGREWPFAIIRKNFIHYSIWTRNCERLWATTLPIVKLLLSCKVPSSEHCRVSTKMWRIARAFLNSHSKKEFAEGFDPLWDSSHKEPEDSRFLRLKAALDEIFTNDDSTYITIWAHSGSIVSILEVIGHRKFLLKNGGMIPLVVRAEF